MNFEADFGYEQTIDQFSKRLAEVDNRRAMAEAKLEQVKATVRFLYPDDMTPSAKRIFDSILEDKE